MAQRDYVSRGRTPQKKKPAGKGRKPARSAQSNAQSNTPVSGKLPIVRLVGVFALVIGFGAFLWSIKDNVEDDVDTQASRPVAPTEETLPELPEEEWEYIKTLPGYEVEVEVKEQEKSDKRYLMQCASFRTRAQAEEMKAKIAFQGLEALIKTVLTTGWNAIIRLILGTFQAN